MIRPPSTTFSAPPPPPPDHYTPLQPPYFSNLWVDNNQELPPESISWSQLLLGGLSNIVQRKNGMENLEEQLLHQHSNGSLSDVGQEYSTKSYNLYYGHEYERVVAKSSWLPMPPAVSPPTSCVTTLNSNKLVDLSGKKLDSRRPPLDHSSEVRKEKVGDRVTDLHQLVSPFGKVRKVKVGDKITALHQLVSPFGKTDTTSVLSEAIGYIRFLQSQIQALTVPYLGNTSGKMRMQQHQPQNESCEDPKKDLKSRGLCLVPISCTLQVGNDNGADYWTPTALGGGAAVPVAVSDEYEIVVIYN